MPDEPTRPTEDKAKPANWSDFIQQGIAIAMITSIFWVPLFSAIAAVFVDGIFGTKIIETFKSLKP